MVSKAYFRYNLPTLENKPQISFIVPVYNEEENIMNVLSDLHRVLANEKGWGWEVIVIEDGSKDRTRKVLLEEAKKYPQIQLILHDKNQGYTASLKEGIQRAKGKYLMYVGADEEFDCAEIPRFANHMLSNGPQHADVVLGVRWQRDSYKLGRYFVSVLYIFLLNYLFKLRVNDYNWSQAWPREFFEKVKVRSKSLFVLPEIIIRSHDLNYTVKEIPSNHQGRQRGKSSLNFRIMAHALLEALSFWRYRKSPKYSPTH